MLRIQGVPHIYVYTIHATAAAGKTCANVAISRGREGNHFVGSSSSCHDPALFPSATATSKFSTRSHSFWMASLIFFTAVWHLQLSPQLVHPQVSPVRPQLSLRGAGTELVGPLLSQGDSGPLLVRSQLSPREARPQLVVRSQLSPREARPATTTTCVATTSATATTTAHCYCQRYRYLLLLTPRSDFGSSALSLRCILAGVYTWLALCEARLSLRTAARFRPQCTYL